MSVDFYVCEYCGETFCDCGPHIFCVDCCRMFCCQECAECEYDELGNYANCRYCKGDDATLDEVFEFAVDLLNKLEPGANHTFKSLKKQCIAKKKNETD